MLSKLLRILLCTLLCLGLTQPLHADSVAATLPIKNLYTKGDVFNIEAGRPALHLKNNALWVNLAMVLDRPLIDGQTLDEITAKNGYPLKEMSMQDYNETNVNLSILLITNYYIENGRQLLNIEKDKPLNFMIQVHRNSSGPKMIDHIVKLMTCCLKTKLEQTVDSTGSPLLVSNDKNIHIFFRKGSNPKTDFDQYNYIDILFSVSLVGGLNPELKTGTLTYAKDFIPFDIFSYQFFPKQKYSVQNRLYKDLDAILEQPQEIYFKELNEKFHSPNPYKNHVAKVLTKKDFHPVTSLQIEGSFYPKDPKRPVIVLE